MLDEMAMASTAPPYETCVAVGQEDYSTRAREEARRYIELIRQKLGPEPPGARLTVKSCPHDFGMYLDVVCRFDTEDQEATEYANMCESDGPRSWNDSQPLVKEKYQVGAYIQIYLQEEVEAVSEHTARIKGEWLFREKLKQAGYHADDIDAFAKR